MANVTRLKSDKRTDPPRADEADAAAREAARLRRILDHASEEILIIDSRTLRFIEVNRAARRNLGYTLEELREMTPHKVVPDMVARELESVLRPLLNGHREAVVVESEHLRKDGSRYPVTVRLELDHGTNPPLLIAYVTDQTDVIELLAQIRLVTDAGAFHFTKWQLDSGRIVRDPEIDRLYGFDDHDPQRVMADFRARVAPEHLADNIAAFEALTRRDIQIFDRTFRVLWPSGEQRWIRAVGQLSNHNPNIVIGLQCDVTDAVLAEQARETARKELDSLLTYLPDYISRATADTTLTFVNEPYARFLNATPDQLIGRKFLEFVPKPHRAGLQAALAALTPDAPMITTEERSVAPDGTVTCLLWTNMATFDGDTPIELISVGRDISEQDNARQTIQAQANDLQRSNEALRESEDRFQLAVQGASVGIWDWPLDGDGTQFWSEKLYEMLGLAPGEVPPHIDNFTKLVHPDDIDTMTTQLDRHFSTGENYECAFRVRHASGDYRWFIDTGTASRDENGKPVRMVGTMMDIHDRKAAEAELRDNEARFRSLYNDTPVMLHSIDGSGQIISVSDYWLEKMGYGREEVLGRPATDFMTAESREKAREAFLPEFFRTGLARDVPYQMVRNDGTIIDVLLSANAIYNADGSIQRSLAVVTDITEKKAIEDALARNQRELELIFDHVPVRIWHKDDENRVLRLNKRAAEAIGRPAEEIEGHLVTEWAPPELAERFHQEDLEVIRSGKPMLGIVEQRKAPDGRIEWMRTDKVPYADPETGRTLLLATSTDITEQKMAELELGRQKQELQLIFENVPVKIFYKDGHNHVLKANRQAAASLGLTVDEAEGCDIYDIFDNDEAATYHADDIEVIKSGKAKLGEIKEFTPIGGSPSWISSNKVPYTDPVTGEARILLAVTDITELKNAQLTMAEQSKALQRSNEELEQFAYVASHDLKAPLRGIDNLASWIEEDMADRMDEESRNNMTLLRSRVARLEQLLTSLLHYSRIGRSKTEVTRVDLGAVAAEVFDLVRGEMPFTFACDGTPELVTGTVPLELVLRNLFSNAIKHHDQPSGRITLEASDEGDRIHIAVSDDGPGIAPQFHQQIFGMFQVLKPRDQVEASGLGLAMIEKQLRALDCRIWIESDPAVQRGTTFHFTWPKTWPYGAPADSADRTCAA